MDFRKGISLRILTMLLVVTCHSINPSESFFLPRFFRRQVTPQPPFSLARGQVSDSEYQPQVRIVNRQRGNNDGENNDGLPNQGNHQIQHHIPKALCLACEKFPWTPVAGAENISPSVGGGHAGDGITDQLEPQATQQQTPQQFRVHIQEQPYQGGSELPYQSSGGNQNTPGGTFVISAVSTNQGNRKPFAMQFDSSKSQNSIRIVNKNQQQQSGEQTSSVSHTARPQIAIPYETPRQPTLLKPVRNLVHEPVKLQDEAKATSPIKAPQAQPQPQEQQQNVLSDNSKIPEFQSQSSVSNSYQVHPEQSAPSVSYGRPVIQQNYQPRPNTGGPTLLLPVKNYSNQGGPIQAPSAFNNNYKSGQPQSFSSHVGQRFPHKIAPITVGTIVAAEHNIRIHDIQPAKLVYQEHTSIHGPTYSRPRPQNYGPPPPKPSYGQPPKVNYGQPPKAGYGPPPTQSYGQPSKAGYGPPPKQNYGLPPKQNYGAPPTQNYGPPPAQNYGPPPTQNYGPPPAQNYGPPPTQNYGPPPTQNYGPPPTQNYGPLPTQNNGRPPIQNYGPTPTQNYGPPPTQNYGPPPTQNYGHPPTQNYIPSPTQNYIPSPTKNYGSSPTQNYVQPPPQNYGQEKPQSSGPVQQSSSPQSFKVPILSNTFGTFTINQIPLESIPNRVPISQSQYGSPPKPGYGQQPPQTYLPPPSESPPKPTPPPAYLPPKQQPQSYGPPPQLPQRPVPPQKPYRPPPPKPAYGTPNKEYAPFLQTEMRPPPPPEFDDSQYRPHQHIIFQSNVQNAPSQGTVLFRRPQATLQFGPAQQSVPTLSTEIQQNYGTPPEVHIQVSNQPIRPINIPNVLQIQSLYQKPNQEYPQEQQQQANDNVAEFQRSKPVTIQSDAFSQQSVNQQIEQENSVKESDQKQRDVTSESESESDSSILSSHPISAPPAEQKFVKNPHIQSIDSNQEQEMEQLKDEQELEDSAAPPTVPSGTVGAWEIVPAQQYDITHLFNKNKQKLNEQNLQSHGSDKHVQEQTSSGFRGPIPIPLPIPIPESHISGSKSPVFIVGHHRPIQNNPPLISYPSEQPNNHLSDFEDQQQIQLQQQQQHQQHQHQHQQQDEQYADQETLTLVPTVQPSQFTPTTQQQQEFRYQTQYDPLPPSIVSALQHAQRTSFLTHQHLTPSVDGSQEPGTVYVNSVTVSESPDEAEVPQQQQHQEQGSSYSDESEENQPVPVHRPHFRAILESSIIDEEGNRIKTVKEVPVYSARPFIPDSSGGDAEQQNLGEQEAASGDHAVANCNSSPHWVIPVNHPNAQQVPEDSQQPGETRKPYLYYYPAPLSSVYWVEQPQLAESAPSGQKQNSFGEKLKPIYTSVPTTSETAQSAEGSSNNVHSKPLFQWSKIIHPSNGNSGKGAYSTSFMKQISAGTNEEGKDAVYNLDTIQTSTSTPFDILAFGRQPVEIYNSQSLDESVEPEFLSTTETSNPSLDHQEREPQLFLGSDSFESNNSPPRVVINSHTTSSSPQSFRVPVLSGESNGVGIGMGAGDEGLPMIYRPKSPKFVDDTYPALFETGGTNAIGNSFEVIGPTTGVECTSTSESTAETGIPTSFTFTTESYNTYADEFTGSFPTTTFTPSRLMFPGLNDKIKLRVGSRFPSGRPGLSSLTSESRVTTESPIRDPSSGSASIQVPVYRPRGTNGVHNPSSSGIFPTNILTLEDIYKSSEIKQLGQELSTTTITPTTITSTEQSVFVSISSDEDVVTITPTKFKFSTFTPSKRIVNREPIVDFVTSVTIPTTDQTQTQTTSEPQDSSTTTLTDTTSTTQVTTEPSDTTTNSPSMSTKVVKTVRVRQRMQTGSFGSLRNSGPLRTRLGGPGGPSRIRVVQRPVSQEYIKNFPEYITREADLLGEDEQKEVKNALIEIKKLK